MKMHLKEFAQNVLLSSRQYVGYKLFLHYPVEVE